MSDFVFNIAKGRVRMFFDAVKENSTVALPGSGGTSTANAVLVVVPIEATGIEADDTLNNYDDLSTLLAAANNEQTTMGRKTLADSVLTASSPDDTNNRLDLDIPDQTWTGASGNPVAKLLVCFDPDSTAGTDSSIIPLTAHDFSVTPDGSDITAQIAAAGFYRAS
jgi:hypothetical protein